MGFGSNQIVTGIDVGSSSVKIVRLSHTRGAQEIVGLALAEILEGKPASGDDNEAEVRRRVVNAINRALESVGVDPGRAGTVVSAVSGSSVSVKHVAFPNMNDKELTESVHWEAKKHIPFESSSADLDYQRLKRSDTEQAEQTYVLLGAAQEGLLDDHIALLAEAGIEPSIVDLAPVALINEVDDEGFLDGKTVAVVDLGKTAANLSVYTRGGLFFARSIPISSTRVDWLEHVLTEVRFSLAFYNNETGRKGIEMLYIADGRSLESGVGARFAETLGVPTEFLDPLAAAGGADFGGELKALSPRFALAMGLARRR